MLSVPEGRAANQPLRVGRADTALSDLSRLGGADARSNIGRELNYVRTPAHWSERNAPWTIGRTTR